MLAMALLRILGVLIFLPAAVLLLIGGRMAWSWVGLSLLACAVGIGLAMAGDRGLKKRRQAKVDALRSDAAVTGFSAGALTVGFRWLAWAGLSGVALAFVAIAIAVAIPGVSSGKFGILIVCGVVGTVFLLLFVAALLQPIAVARAGYLMHMDMRGFQHAALPLIAWKHVIGIDHRQIKVNNQTQHILAFGILQPFADELAPSASWSFSTLSAPKLKRATGVLEVPLRLAAMSPEAVVAAARAICDRTNPNRLRDWSSYEDVSVAVSRRAAQAEHDQETREVDALLARINAMSAAEANDPTTIARIEVEMKRLTDAQLQAMDQGLAAHRTVLDKKSKEVQQVKWVVILLFVIALAWIASRVWSRMAS